MEHGTDKLKCNKMHVILLCNEACCFNKKNLKMDKGHWNTETPGT